MIILAIVINVILLKYNISLMPDFIENYWGDVISENLFLYSISMVSLFIFFMIFGIEILKKTIQKIK